MIVMTGYNVVQCLPTDNHQDGDHKVAQLQDVSGGAVGGGGVLGGLGGPVGRLLRGGSVSGSRLGLIVSWLRGAVPRRGQMRILRSLSLSHGELERLGYCKGGFYYIRPIKVFSVRTDCAVTAT